MPLQDVRDDDRVKVKEDIEGKNYYQWDVYRFKMRVIKDET
jgi:hypothetical protein